MTVTFRYSSDISYPTVKERVRVGRVSRTNATATVGRNKLHRIAQPKDIPMRLFIRRSIVVGLVRSCFRITNGMARRRIPLIR